MAQSQGLTAAKIRQWYGTAPADLMQMLDNVSAAADNMLHAYARRMSAADYQQRRTIIAEARQLCDEYFRRLRP